MFKILYHIFLYIINIKNKSVHSLFIIRQYDRSIHKYWSRVLGINSALCLINKYDINEKSTNIIKLDFDNIKYLYVKPINPSNFLLSYETSRKISELSIIKITNISPDIFEQMDKNIINSYVIKISFALLYKDFPLYLSALEFYCNNSYRNNLYLEGRFDPRDIADYLPSHLARLTTRFQPVSAMLGPAGRKKVDKWIATGTAATGVPDTFKEAAGDGPDTGSGLPRALVVLKAAGDVDRVLGMAGDELDGRQPVVLLMSRNHDQFADEFFERGGFLRETVLYFTEIRKHPARGPAAARAARAMKPAFSSNTTAAHLVAAQMKDIVSLYIQADTLDSIIRTWRPEVVIGCFEKTNWVPLLAAGEPRPRIVNLQHGFNPRLHLLDLMDIDSFRVWDQSSADTAIADGIPPDRIMIVENPHRRRLKEAGVAFTGTERYQQWQDWKAGRTLVAIMGQPDTTGAISPQDNRALARAVAAALKHRSDMVAVLRPHPRQPDATLGPELRLGADIDRARVATQDDLELGELLALADVAVGIHSTALADAHAIGVPAFAFDFHGRFAALGLDERQVSEVARTEREAINLLKHFGRPQHPAPQGFWARLLSKMRGPE
ncbi:hypothetical protein [Fodinicurvata sp. EGI_FJ10296]|uniref:hypothetical protein n=1 Tax=Fodinicurvata sp. EGI_FJ10296 TaxID=3231908 RepID=UPI0034518610